MLFTLKVCIAFLALVCVFATKGPVDFRLTISPAHKHVTPGDDVTVLCQATAPLSRCQFRVGEDAYVEWGNSQDPPLGYAHSGAGLSLGECGLTLSAELVRRYDVILVTCRVRGSKSGWKQAAMPVIVSRIPDLHVRVRSREVLALPGKDISVTFTSLERMSNCSVFMVDSWIDLFESDESNRVPRRECTLELKDVGEADNGLLWFRMGSRNKGHVDFVRLVVAKSPRKPTLESRLITKEDGGKVLEASCTVLGSRPPARISWVLENEPLTEEDAEMLVIDDDRSTEIHEERPLTQKIIMDLNDSHGGKNLWCNVDHPTLSEGIQSRTFKIPSVETNLLPGGHRIYTKEDWGGRPAISSRPLYALPHPTPYVIISHTAGPTCFEPSNCFSICRDIQDLSTGQMFEGADILFNFLVGGDGNIYVGRSWDFTNPRDGKAVMKRNNVDLCIIGNFMNNEPTGRQLSAIRELINLGVRLGKLDQNYKLVSHNDTTPTLSPGTNLYKHIKTWPHFIIP